MKIKLFLLTLTSLLMTICCQHEYVLEFMDERIFRPCEQYPNNFIDQLFNMSNVNFDQTEDGSMLVNGYSVVTTTVEKPMPFTVEIFKKERGTWQPTVYSQKRDDACVACFSETEYWYSYMENTPKEQKTCPFTKGQRLDFDINEQTNMTFPVRNGEGEYKMQAKAGTEKDDFFVCVDILVFVHKI